MNVCGAHVCVCLFVCVCVHCCKYLLFQLLCLRPIAALSFSSCPYRCHRSSPGNKSATHSTLSLSISPLLSLPPLLSPVWLCFIAIDFDATVYVFSAICTAWPTSIRDTVLSTRYCSLPYLIYQNFSLNFNQNFLSLSLPL